MPSPRIAPVVIPDLDLYPARAGLSVSYPAENTSFSSEQGICLAQDWMSVSYSAESLPSNSAQSKSAAPLRLTVWHCRSGRRVVAGEPLLELCAGEVVVDVPSPADGTLRRLVPEDDLVIAGQTVAEIHAGEWD